MTLLDEVVLNRRSVEQGGRWEVKAIFFLLNSKNLYLIRIHNEQTTASTDGFVYVNLYCVIGFNGVEKHI